MNTLPKVKVPGLDMEASRLGLGGFHQVEISSEIVESVISAYIEEGGNYIETARGYGSGTSEEKIGKAIAGRRDGLILASKSGNRSADGIRKDLETTLTNLETDHIEFYFFHGVGSEGDIKNIMKKGGCLDELLKAKEEGLIKGVGMSSHRPWLYMDGLRDLPLSVILIWDNYLEEQYLPEIQKEIYPLAHEKDVLVTAMKPLADGFLWKSAENAFRYTLGKGADVLVSGMNSPDQVRSAAEAIRKGALSDDERKDVLKNAPELGEYVCRRCGNCTDKLMELFRLEGFTDRQMIDYLSHDPADYALRFRLAGWFGLADEARERFKNRDFNSNELFDSALTSECPYGIDIIRKTRLAITKLREEDCNRL